ncbi:MAG: hypothetical protein IKH31_02215 [Clostridia bacterium]|nr:hypothetical protein [Clostridia bacterium]
MLKKVFALTGALLVLVTILSGCAHKRFRAEVPEGESAAAADPAKAGTITAELGGRAYDCSYDISYVSDFSGKTYDRFRTGERGRIVIDPETGEVIRFFGITPFEPIDGAAELTDTELVSAVRERISSLVDTEKYGESNVTRYSQNGKETSSIVVKLFQKDVKELNNSVSVTVNAEGEIEDYSRIDGWTGGTAPIEISNEERDALIRSAVEKKIVGKLGEVKIQTELLTLYKGESALLYLVTAIDDKGFDHGLFPVVIFGR